MKKNSTCMLAIVMITILLVGCGNKPNGTEGQTDNSNTEETQTADNSEQLIIYTNSGSEGRAEWLKERAAQEGYNIEVVGIAASDLTNRLIAEKNNSQADVVFGLNSIEFEKLKREDLLLKYEPDWSSEVDVSLGDADGLYYPIVVQPLVLMYNNEINSAPADWIELVDEQYADQFTMLALGSGTGKTIYASILVRYMDDNGVLGISDEGWSVMEKIIANAHFYVEGEDYVGAVIDGTRPMTSMWGSGVLQNQTERGYEFGIMSPEVGVPYVVEQVAIVSNTKKAALAEEFINWFGLPETQLEWSKEFGTIPVAEAALEQVSDDIRGFMEKVHPQEIDWEFVGNNIEQWVEKAELELVR